LNYHPVNK